MKNIKPELINVLACPNCRSELFEVNNRLKCKTCSIKYEIRNRIPLLYPDNIDLEHLKEEENLAKMMKQPTLNKRGEFNSIQWKNSKKEFWNMVKHNITKSATKTILYIGCGYDNNFISFEQEGCVFINFDIVFNMLYNLQRDFGAKSCVAGDINSMPFKENSFDYVVSIDTIHHEYNKLPIVLNSLSNLLKPGGILFLEDPNAWGMFQIAKSVLLPKSLHSFLRSNYHRLKKSTHKPADYEFPTSVWHVRKILNELGFRNITIYPNNAYPNIGLMKFRIYKFLSKIEWVKKYHNFHYMLSAIKSKYDKTS